MATIEIDPENIYEIQMWTLDKNRKCKISVAKFRMFSHSSVDVPKFTNSYDARAKPMSIMNFVDFYIFFILFLFWKILLSYPIYLSYDWDKIEN